MPNSLPVVEATILDTPKDTPRPTMVQGALHEVYEYLTTRDLANILHIGRTSAWEIVVERHEIPHTIVSASKIIIRRCDAEAWLKNHRYEAAGGRGSAPTSPLSDEYLRLCEVAPLLYLATSSARRLIVERREISYYRTAPKTIRVARSEVEAYLSANRYGEKEAS